MLLKIAISLSLILIALLSLSSFHLFVQPFFLKIVSTGRYIPLKHIHEYIKRIKQSPAGGTTHSSKNRISNNVFVITT